jgi:hypothetical protein
LPVTLSVKSGPAQMSTSNSISFNGVGTVMLAANQGGDTNYIPAPEVTTSFSVIQASNTIGAFGGITATKAYTTSPVVFTIPTATSKLPVTVTVLSGPAALITSNSLSFNGVGTVTLAANQSGNSYYVAAAQVTTNFSVIQASNTIGTFGGITATKTYLTSPVVFTIPTATSKLPVTVTVKSGPAVLIDTNKISLTGAGTVTLAANQPGNANYLAAPEVTTNCIVTSASNTIAAFAVIPAKTYSTSPVVFTVPAATSMLPVTVTVKSGPAVLIDTNKVSLTGSGTVTLAANQPGNSGFLPAPQVTTSFTVAKAPNTITFPVIATKTNGAAPFLLGATASSGLPVSYSSTNTNLIGLSGNVVSILGAGTVTIVASQPGNSGYTNATPVTNKFTVTAPASSTNAFTNQIAGVGVASGIPTIPSLPILFPLTVPQTVGTVVAWGNNTYLQTNLPAGLTNVVQLSSRGLHTLALRSDGTVSAWGWNSYGQTNVPMAATNVVQVAAGVSFSAALSADGTVLTWGDGSLGQTNVPAGLTNAVQIAAGSDHTLALRSDGSVIAWGWNDYGQCNVPSDATNVVQISAGYFHSVALKADGTVEAWGDNTYSETNVPAGLTNVVRIATGLNHTVALKGDGTVVAWGWNNAGQTDVPAGLSGVARIATGGNTVFAVTTNGTLVTWGDNSYGQRKIPTGLSKVIQFVLGLYHAAALKN